MTWHMSMCDQCVSKTMRPTHVVYLLTSVDWEFFLSHIHIKLSSHLHNLQYQYSIDIAYFVRNVYVPFHLDFYSIVIPLMYRNWLFMQIETRWFFYSIWKFAIGYVMSGRSHYESHLINPVFFYCWQTIFVFWFDFTNTLTELSSYN